VWKESYLENQVLTADPMELVRMLYRAAVDAVRDARKRLAAGDILERSNAINRAIAMIGELSGSLDQNGGGEIGRRLADLYSYMIQGLVQANLRQQDAPLAEVEALLTTLSDGWEQASCAEAVDSPAAYQSYDASADRQAHQWSA